MNSITRLTYGLVNGFGNRKEPGRLSILVNTDTGDIYAVPREVEHIDFAKKLVRSDFFGDYSHLVPVHVDMRGMPERIFRLITGVSGLETGFGVRHRADQLQKARDTALCWIQNGDVALEDSIEDSIVTRYRG